MKKKRTKKYPIFTYLCYLLAVAALVTSVTFARYSVATSGSVSTQVALYNCSYEIDGFSSFAFNNTDFYIMNGNNLIGNTTARTVRFTMRNHSVNADGELIGGTITDVNVQGSIRLRVPAELGDKLAIQLTDATAAGASSTVVTPQIVLGELLYYGGVEDGKIITSESYADFSKPVNDFSTAYFSNYEERTNNDEALDQEWTVSGGLTTTDGVTKGAINIVQNVDEGTGLNMTITAETDKEPETYSVGFRRSSGTSLFLDLSKKMTYYTIEISLPSMLLEGKKQRSCTHVAYLSLVNRLANSVYWYDLELNGGQPIAIDKSGNPISGNDPENDSNFLGYQVTDDSYGLSVDNSDSSIKYITADNLVCFDNGEDDDLSNDPIVTNMNQLITAPPSDGERYYIKKDGQEITVLGYHFEQNTTMTVPGDNDTDTESTTIVRVNCAYDYQADENGNGTYTVTLDHVAPIEAAAANYIHSIESFLYSDGKPASPTLTNLSYISTPFAGLTGTCSNNVSTINLSSVTLNPFTNAENQVTVQMAVNRSFNLRMKAAFVQASTLPGS